jgi:hypothetical protein
VVTGFVAAAAGGPLLLQRRLAHRDFRVFLPSKKIPFSTLRTPPAAPARFLGRKFSNPVDGGRSTGERIELEIGADWKTSRRGIPGEAGGGKQETGQVKAAGTRETTARTRSGGAGGVEFFSGTGGVETNQRTTQQLVSLAAATTGFPLCLSNRGRSRNR